MTQHATRSMPNALVTLYVAGCAGLLAELALTGHYEDWVQWIPIVLLIIGLGAGVAWLRRPVAATGIALRLSGWLLSLGGLIGTFLHFKGNREFELEMYPDLDGFGLITESLTGATPVLAPGASILLGLLVVIATHPRYLVTK